jgi:hypothetical protein
MRAARRRTGRRIRAVNYRLPCQATVTAVQAVNAEVKTASSAMAMRMTATSAKLSEGAASYVSQDEFSASSIETVSPTFRV